MINFDNLKNNGYFDYEGREYVCIQQAYLAGTQDNPYYMSDAICKQDVPDEDGWMPLYEVRWEMIADEEDESFNADWDEPYSVKKAAEYNIENGRIC